MNDYSSSRLNGNRDFARQHFDFVSLDLDVPSGHVVYFRWVLEGHGGNSVCFWPKVTNKFS